MNHDDLEGKLAEIKLAYQSELPTKTNQLKLLFRDIQSHDWSPDRVQEMHRLVHSLAGSGATFGFDELSVRARKLEHELKALVQDAPADPNTIRGRIPALFEALQQVLQEASQAGVKPRAVSDIETSQQPVDRPLYLLGEMSEEIRDLCEQLSYYGYRVECLSDLNALRSHLDETRPVGILVAQAPSQELRDTLVPFTLKGSPDSRIPVVFIHDRFDLDIRLDAVRCGCGAFFTWPVDAGVIANRLDQLTQRQVVEPYRILVVEDDVDIAKHYAVVLSDAGFNVQVVNRPLEAMRILSEFNPELILMDIYMPDCSGVELAAVIRQEDAYVGVPIVYLSTETDLSKQIDAMRQGGDEFLTKPIEPHLLVASVRCRVQRSRVLNSFLHRDSLTGLLNHTSTKEALATEVERARRRGTAFTFAMIDIDRFKSVNDTHGHPVGDRVIKSLARLLQQRLRKTDVVGRFGGEEFALLLPETSLDNAVPVLEELRESFENIRQTYGDAEFRVSFSCGAVAYPDHHSAEDILCHADAALYKAKHQGRNRVVVSH